MTEAFSRYRALSFDCYGTLIDWETGIWDALQPVIAASGRSDVTRARALSMFARHETALQAGNPRMLYRDLLAGVHRRFAEELNLPSTVELDATFGRSVGSWPAFADTADVLVLHGYVNRYQLI